MEARAVTKFVRISPRKVRLVVDQIRGKGVEEALNILKFEIERAANKAKINIYTARPGIVIGKKGAEIEKLKEEIGKLTTRETYINIHEVRRPDLDATLVSEHVALQLERRVAFRRAMKESVSRAMRMGAQGVRIQSAGRLGGSGIARTEWDPGG